MSAESAEARQHPRARATIQVEYHFGSTRGTGTTCNISEGGMFLSCGDTAPPGTRIYLRLHLRPDAEPLKIVGVVRRAAGPPEGAGLGVHFEVAYARTRESLAEFVDHLLAAESDRAESAGFALRFAASADQAPGAADPAVEVERASPQSATTARGVWIGVMLVAVLAGLAAIAAHAWWSG